MLGMMHDEVEHFRQREVFNIEAEANVGAWDMVSANTQGDRDATPGDVGFCGISLPCRLPQCVDSLGNRGIFKFEPSDPERIELLAQTVDPRLMGGSGIFSEGAGDGENEKR